MIEVISIEYTKSRANTFNVPLKQWRKWSLVARQAFNEVYSSMVKNQEFYVHPKQDKLSKSHWKTICWNAAWTAANAIY